MITPVTMRTLLKTLSIGLATCLTAAAELIVSPAEITIESENDSLIVVCRPHGVLQTESEGDLYPRCSLEFSEDGGETWQPTDTTLSSALVCSRLHSAPSAQNIASPSTTLSP